MFSTLAAITTTPAGLRCLAPLCEEGSQLWIAPKLEAAAKASGLTGKTYEASLADLLKDIWNKYDGLVFCLASGAVVRLIAPLLTDKSSDPAIVVVDPDSKFVISLCGGHQGGADRITQRLSQLLEAQPVLTGASNALDLPAIDTLGDPFGWKKGTGNWLGVSSAIAHQAPVQIVQEAGTDLWQQHLPKNRTFQFGFPEFEDRNNHPTPQARVWISPMLRTFNPDAELPKVQWHPRVLWLGLGCERGTDKALIAYAVEKVCAENHLAVGAIAGIATLSLKADEAGLLAFVQEKNWPLECFEAETLKSTVCSQSVRSS